MASTHSAGQVKGKRKAAECSMAGTPHSYKRDAELATAQGKNGRKGKAGKTPKLTRE